MVRASRRKARKRPPASARPDRRSSARAQKLEPLLDELGAVAEAVGIRVRRERLLREVGYHVRSGLCRVGSEEVLLIDLDLDPDLQLEQLLSVLSGRELGDVPLSDEVQRLLASQ